MTVNAVSCVNPLIHCTTCCAGPMILMKGGNINEVRESSDRGHQFQR